MANIFQNAFKNLEYLNLENNGINNDGLKFLQNKSLINIKYLNLANNPITDFINKINIVKCDKKKLTLKFVSSNYDKFFFQI